MFGSRCGLGPCAEGCFPGVSVFAHPPVWGLFLSYILVWLHLYVYRDPHTLHSPLKSPQILPRSWCNKIMHFCEFSLCLPFPFTFKKKLTEQWPGCLSRSGGCVSMLPSPAAIHSWDQRGSSFEPRSYRPSWTMYWDPLLREKSFK